MEELGIVGKLEGSKPRQLLITRQQWQEMTMAWPYAYGTADGRAKGRVRRGRAAMILAEAEINAMSSLALAHMGDAVYELMVRREVCRSGRLTAGELHRQTVRHVSAGAQARAGADGAAICSRRRRTPFTAGAATAIATPPFQRLPGRVP